MNQIKLKTEFMYTEPNQIENGIYVHVHKYSADSKHLYQNMKKHKNSYCLLDKKNGELFSRLNFYHSFSDVLSKHT